MKTGDRWKDYVCEAEGCMRWIRWSLVYCTVCAARLGRNESRNDKVRSRQSIRPAGRKGW